MSSTLSLAAGGASSSNQMSSSQPEERDQFGNLVMSLRDIGLEATIRYAKYEDGVRLAQIDIVKAVTGKKADYAAKIIERMSNEVHEEICENSASLKFKGQGQKETTLITFQGAIKLIMALPGENARDIRTKFATILQRYFAGDPGLVGELFDNNQSSSPINQVAREDTGVQQVSVQEHDELEKFEKYSTQLYVQFKKRRRLELADVRGERKHEKDMKQKELEIQKEKTTTEKEAQLKIEKEREKIREELAMKRQDRKEEREHMLEMLAMKEKMREKSPPPTVHVNVGTVHATNNNSQQQTQPVSPPVNTPVTVESIAEMFKLLEGVQNRNIRDNILSQVGKRLKKDPFNMQPVGKKASMYSDKYEVNEYASHYLDIIKDAIISTRDDMVRKVGTKQNVMDAFMK